MGFGFESISHWLHFHAWCTLILALLLYNKIGNRVHLYFYKYIIIILLVC